MVAGSIAFAMLTTTRPAHAEGTPAAPTPPAACRGAIQHPLEVKVEALDQVRRGQAVRVRVTTQSRRTLLRAEVRIVHTGGAWLVTPDRVLLGALAADTPASAEFSVKVPQGTRRALLQFVILADEDGFRIGRGATLNLLPDGPQQAQSIVTNADGTKTKV